ncbi:MAG: hypothetical protein J5732_03070 [Bacteroidaceae bacterium]|nr:hypothetical protein [Bacteroidaceae bacterium]
MALGDLVKQERGLLGIVGAVGVHVEGLLLTVLLDIVLWVSDCENHLGGVLGDGAKLYLLDSAGLVLAGQEALVVEEHQFVDVLNVGGDGDLQVFQHLVVKHGSATDEVNMKLLGHSLHLRKIDCVSHNQCLY